ncbi:MAG: Zn-ribbon domain-containing OB-fold protein [Pseudomonadales bacterium]
MSEQAQTRSTGPLPVVNWLKLPADGEPYLEGHKCGSCGAIFLGEREVCSKCGARGKMAPAKLANTGKLYSFSIVYRSFPGIEVPYISAIVDLDGGGTVKGNLIGVEADPDKINFDMPVQVVFDDALGRKDQDGNSYISYFFKPAA